MVKLLRFLVYMDSVLKLQYQLFSVILSFGDFVLFVLLFLVCSSESSTFAYVILINEFH